MKIVGQIGKFGIVGFAAFCIDYGLMVVLTELLGVNYLLSATISFVCSVAFNYVASMRYVFTSKEGMSKKKEAALFFILSLIGLGLNDLILFVGSDLAGISYLITKIAATAIVMVWNFVTRKVFLDAS